MAQGFRVSGLPMTPEFTLRPGASNSTFNIEDTQIKPAALTSGSASDKSSEKSVSRSKERFSSSSYSSRHSETNDTSAAQTKTTSKSEDEFSSGNDESFEISVVLGTKGRKTQTSQINRKLATTEEPAVSNKISTHLPELATKESLSSESEDRCTPSPISRPLSDESHTSGRF